MLNSGVILNSKSTGSKPALPRKRSKLKRKFCWKRDCSPRPKKSNSPGSAELATEGTGMRRRFRGGLADAGDGEEEAAADDGVVALVGVAIVRIEQARGGVDGGEALVGVAAGRRCGKDLPAIGDGSGLNARHRGLHFHQRTGPARECVGTAWSCVGG